MENLKLVLVGFGVRGKQWLKAVRKIKKIKLVGIVENDIKKFNDCKSALRKGEQFFKSLQCLRTIEFNCIILATPPNIHFKQIKHILNKNIDIICEKPLTESFKSSLKLKEMVDNSNSSVIVGMNFRYLNTSKEYKSLIDSKRFGPIGYGCFRYIRNRNPYRDDLNKYPIGMTQPMLLEQTIHHIDLMRYCYQSEIQDVTAQTWRVPWSSYENDCSVSILLNFENFHVNYIGTWTSGWNKFSFEWRTDFQDGVVIQKDQFCDLNFAQLESKLGLIGKNFKTEKDAEILNKVKISKDKSFESDTFKYLQDYLNNKDTNIPMRTNLIDYLKSYAVIEACIESNRKRKTINLEKYYRYINL